MLLPVRTDRNPSRTMDVLRRPLAEKSASVEEIISSKPEIHR
jgi:hypothetical protein